MRLHDLPGDGEAEPRILAELVAFRPVRIETLEDVLDVLRADAGAVVVDRDEDPSRLAAGSNANATVGGREGKRVVDQVIEDLTQAAVMAEHVERVLPASAVVQRQLNLPPVFDPGFAGDRDDRLQQPRHVYGLGRFAG